MIIRTFRLSDVYPLIQMWEEVLPQTSEALELLSEQLSHDSDLVLVAEKEGKVVGVIVGTVNEGKGLIHRIAVAPSCRGQGVGRKLLQGLQRRYQTKGIEHLYCSVDHFNALALPFYRAMGLRSLPHSIQSVG